jgi:hypothetical protein
MRFFGVVTVDGQPAAAGTTIRAFIDNNECGSSQVMGGGTYVIDVLGVTLDPNCARDGQSVQFRIDSRVATQSPTFRTGGFEMLNLTFGGAPQGPFNGAAINLDAPCAPPPGQSACSAEDQLLWTADRDAWARHDPPVVEQPPFVPFEGPVFEATIIFRVERRDPKAIMDIARILGNPFLQVTLIRFTGTEYVEVTNLGGGGQDMAGWSLTAPGGQRFSFPALTMQGGQVCRVYSGPAPANNPCGNLSFGQEGIWPDSSGRIVLFFDALNLPGDDKLYSADPNNQPPPPNLQGVVLP